MFVVVVWFCRPSSLAFLISANLINLMHHFLLHWVICFGGYLFVHTTVFLKYLNFLCFLLCSSFGRKLCQNCGWGGRNLMFDRTLPSRLVFLYLQSTHAKFFNFLCSAFIQLFSILLYHGAFEDRFRLEKIRIRQRRNIWRLCEILVLKNLFFTRKLSCHFRNWKNTPQSLIFRFVQTISFLQR